MLFTFYSGGTIVSTGITVFTVLSIGSTTQELAESTDEEIDECESDSVKAGMTTLSIIDMISMLRLTTKILVIYGYLLILYLFCSCCIGLAVYKTYRSF